MPLPPLRPQRKIFYSLLFHPAILASHCLQPHYSFTEHFQTPWASPSIFWEPQKWNLHSQWYTDLLPVHSRICYARCYVSWLGQIQLRDLLKTNLHTILLWNWATYWTWIATRQKSCCHHASIHTQLMSHHTVRNLQYHLHVPLFRQSAYPFCPLTSPRLQVLLNMYKGTVWRPSCIAQSTARVPSWGALEWNPSLYPPWQQFPASWWGIMGFCWH